MNTKTAQTTPIIPRFIALLLSSVSGWIEKKHLFSITWIKENLLSSYLLRVKKEGHDEIGHFFREAVDFLEEAGRFPLFP
jgi:hypothetical protein